jgi:dinuclear metal center YbgI/SA1388 family protein
MQVIEVTKFLECLVPKGSQVSYDNCGLLVGSPNQEITGCLVCLDCTEEIIEEAVREGCNFIIAHHPLIFSGIKSITGKNYVERTIIKAIQHNIAIYAIHTNLDNYRFGVNFEIANRLGLINLKVLSPAENVLSKLVIYTPNEYVEQVSQAVFQSGGGAIGEYDQCSFTVEGEGTFRPSKSANPFEGKQGELSRVKEHRLEFLISNHILDQVVSSALQAHPYEEVAYEIYALKNKNQYEGSGMVGELKVAMETEAFLRKIKETFNCGVIRHTEIVQKEIKKVAFCGGSGSFLLRNAKGVNADIFITGDYKYHDFFDAEGQIIIADIGHFESEQYTTNLLADILMKNFSTFVVRKTRVITNPIKYF